MTTVKQAIEKIEPQLRDVSESPRLDVELILSAVIKSTREELYAHPERKLTIRSQRQLIKLIDRRKKGEPVAYLIGHKEFWTLNLDVNSHVLIPRVETELLVEWTLNQFPKEEKIKIADLGTGSGAIALALASECPNWQIDAADNSSKTIKVAKQNAKKNGIKNVKFYLGEWCDALPRNDYHAILGNPPYVPESDSHWPHLRFEPREALAAGGDGLAAIREIIPEARNFLMDGGWLVLEHGDQQALAVVALMQDAGYREVRDFPDLAGLPRMVVGKK